MKRSSSFMKWERFLDLLKFRMKEGPIAGLHIGEENIVAVVPIKDQASHSVQWRRWTVPTPEKCIHNGLVLEPKPLAEAIKRLFVNEEHPSRKIALALTCPGLMTRVINLPQLSTGQIKEALKAEAEKYLLGDDAIVDFYPIDKDHLFLVGLKHMIASSYVSLIQEAGLDLKIIDILPLTVLRSLKRDHPHRVSPRSILFVLVHETLPELSVIKNGLLCYSRTLEFRDYAELAHEVQMTCRYWEEENDGKTIERIVVLIHENETKIFMEEIKKRLPQIPVDTWGSGSLEEWDTWDLISTSALGSALRGNGQKDPFDINLIPPEKVSKDRFMKRAVISLIICTTCLVTFILSSLLFSYRIRYYYNNIQAVSETRRQNLARLEEWEGIRDERHSLMKQLDEKGKHIKGLRHTRWSRIMEELSRLIPHDVWFMDMSMDDIQKTVLLKGQSLSQDAVYQYIQLLSFSDYFEKLHLEIIEFEMEENLAIFYFEISCPLSKADL